MKRIYEKAEKQDGIRILVDRLWPRGISKQDANLDHWLKELAPSDELRKDFHQERINYDTFKKRYKEELKQGEAKKAFSTLQEIQKKEAKTITLLFAAKDEKKNNAKVIQELLH